MKFAALILLLVSNQVFAASWVRLGVNDLGAFFVDKSSLRRNSGILQTDVLQADVLLNWNEPRLLQGGQGAYYSSETSVAYLDCEKKRIGFGSRTMYSMPNAKGERLLSPYLAYPDVRLQDVEAGSTGAQMLKAICAVQKSIK